MRNPISRAIGLMAVIGIMFSCGGCQKAPAALAAPLPTPTVAQSEEATAPAPAPAELATASAPAMAATASAPAEVEAKETTDAIPDESQVKQAKTSGMVVAYYFHRTARCPTCLSIEQQAREAIEEGFITEMEDGSLEWRAVNLDEAGNEHFATDFEVAGSSLVLAATDGVTATRRVNLERVWELVEDPGAFKEYVWSELTEFMAN